MRAGGGIGLTGLVIVVGIAWLMGINPLTVLSQLDGGGSYVPDTRTEAPRPAADDEPGRMACQLLDERR